MTYCRSVVWLAKRGKKYLKLEEQFLYLFLIHFVVKLKVVLYCLFVLCAPMFLLLVLHEIDSRNTKDSDVSRNTFLSDVCSDVSYCMCWLYPPFSARKNYTWLKNNFKIWFFSQRIKASGENILLESVTLFFDGALAVYKEQVRNRWKRGATG